MFDLKIYQIANKTVRPIMTSSVHRWSIFSGTKYLNCEERINRCHSMNFEDYSADKEFLKKKSIETPIKKFNWTKDSPSTKDL